MRDGGQTGGQGDQGLGERALVVCGIRLPRRLDLRATHRLVDSAEAECRVSHSEVLCARDLTSSRIRVFRSDAFDLNHFEVPLEPRYR